MDGGIIAVGHAPLQLVARALHDHACGHGIVGRFVEIET